MQVKNGKRPVQENLPLHLVAAHEPKLSTPVGYLTLDYLERIPQYENNSSSSNLHPRFYIQRVDSLLLLLGKEGPCIGFS